MKTNVLLVLVAAWVMMLSACSGLPALKMVPNDEPPGVGEKAERGYAASEPVIAALEKFHADHGQYPELIVYLAPDYLPVLWTGGDDLDYSYSLGDGGYSFSFHYTGPGMNTCTYKPEAGWHCSGAF
jgi:hypothetical protein